MKQGMDVSRSDIAAELKRLDSLMLEAEKRFGHFIEKVDPIHKQGSINLIHYLSLRSNDIRDLQDKLHEAGLSSLNNSESHIRSQIHAVMKNLGEPADDVSPDYRNSGRMIKEKSSHLFGRCSTSGIPCIMVSFDTSYASNYFMVKRLLLSGMNIARINCAHDDADTWMQMITHVKTARDATGLPCKIYMDLAGPKLRTYIIKGKKKRVEVKEGQNIYLSEQPGMYTDLTEVCINEYGIVKQLSIGHKVLFDDGLIEAVVEDIRPGAVKLMIKRISSKKPFIKNEKGINFPGSDIKIPALTEYDRRCLPFILSHADLVGYSFVNSPADLVELQDLMKGKQLPIIIKIETPGAVKNLPQLLFQGMQQGHFGVMIARGDLAVEIGFERMSEVQDEILWICEAAHIPVVWATQVLETLNKSGVATRSEVTDAAHAIMAEAVLINKGENTLQVIETLKDILHRSGGHHAKKRYTFRPLAIASRFMED